MDQAQEGTAIVLKSLLKRAAGRIGIQRLGPVVFACVASLMLLTSGAALVIINPFAPEWAESGIQQDVHVEVAMDSSGSGLPDALENLIGSDPDRYDTLGQGVADGWIYQMYGSAVDWNDTAFLHRPALVPPSLLLPEALQRPGTIPTISIAQVFHLERERMESEGITGAWWLEHETLHPRLWDNRGDGVADAWLLGHGLHPLEVEVDDSSPRDPALTIRQKYDHGLDPNTRDSSNNGLLDEEAIAGTARLDGEEIHFTPTDPALFDSRGDGIADGYLVRFALDPHDPDVSSSTPAGDGVTVLEAYEVTRDHCEETRDDAEEECIWRERLEEGPWVDPTAWDSLGDGVADAWSLRDLHGIAHPLVDAGTVTTYTTKEWDANPWNPDAWDGDGDNLFGVVVDEENPAPEKPFQLTLFDHYTYLRPSGWNEETDGPWWGGLPTVVETPEGGLPPAVALRGWNLMIDTGMGRDSTDPPSSSDLITIHAFADPRQGDTDGDGLLDVEEYFGAHLESGERIPRTNPADPDTDGDGLSDHEEIFVYGTDPMRRDSSGSYLTDGFEAAYWTMRYLNATELFQSDPATAEAEYSFLLHPGETFGQEILERLGPLGDISGDGVPNIQSASASGDSLKDGQELEPNRFLHSTRPFARPDTDPARTDTDGDRLPDAWEVEWAQIAYYRCGACTGSPGTDNVPGWPLDPSSKVSATITGVDSDWDIDYTADTVRVAWQGDDERFSSGLAYKYNLHPFIDDTSRDGISDMFALHWGIHQVPDFVKQDPPDWAVGAANDLASGLSERGFHDAIPEVVIIDPTRSGQEVGLETNLLGEFDTRAKGTWVYVKVEDTGVCKSPDDPGFLEATYALALPDSTDDPRRSESGHPFDPDNPDEGSFASRASEDFALDPGWEFCWEWVEYALEEEVEHRTNPWRHDLRDDGLPDAWRIHYGVFDESADNPTQGSLDAGCGNPDLHEGLPSLSELGRHSYCITYQEAYERGLDPNSPDTDAGGLVDWIEIALGLDPLDPDDDRGDEDWSGDGIPNWVKDELGLSRLVPSTAPDGLLDGDPGIGWDSGLVYDFVNPVHDRFAEGDYCIPQSDDLVPNMENRPPAPPTNEEGAMTWNELHAWLIEMGIIHETDPRTAYGLCEEGDTLFNRNVALRVDEEGRRFTLGAGAGTDPAKVDSSGDGIPDGWYVYWRERPHVRDNVDAFNALDPNRFGSAGERPSGDFQTNLEAYTWGRPADWDEQTDGIWWGGFDPTRRDTNQNGPWFTTAAHGHDSLDQDADGDGIPDVLDPYPGIDTDNDGIIRWNEETQRYDTDYPTLWAALDERLAASLQDMDDDGVPDFLGRARVIVKNLQIDTGPEGEPVVDKMGDPFVVEGCVVTNEQGMQGIDYDDGSESTRNVTNKVTTEAAPGGSRVVGATVQLLLYDGKREALVGVAFTSEDGCFSVDARAGSQAPVSQVPGTGAHALGRILEGGSEGIAFESSAVQLEPGLVQLHVIVEPNAVNLQSLCFLPPESDPLVDTCLYHAEAFKDVAGSPMSSRFHLPLLTGPDNPNEQGPRLQAALLNETGEPDRDKVRHVRHATDAIFVHRSVLPDDLRLRAPTLIELDLPTSRILQGEPVTIAGLLKDLEGVALGGRTVNLTLSPQHAAGTCPPSGGSPIELTTQSDGTFTHVFDTDTSELGSHDVCVTGRLGEQDVDLIAPEPVSGTLRIAQDTEWSNVFLDGQAGELHTIDALSPFTVDATLLDHRGAPVPQREVTLRVQTLGGESIRQPLTLATDNEGNLSATLPALDEDAPIDLLRLELIALTETAWDEHERQEIFLAPRFSTGITLENATADVGQTAWVEGALLRGDGSPVANREDTRFLAVPDRLDPIENPAVSFQGTDDDGAFRFPVVSTHPDQQTWTVTFLGLDGDSDDGDGFLLPSAGATATVTHVGFTDLEVEDVIGERDRRLEVQGRLVLPDGTPVAGEAVEVRWEDDVDNETVQVQTTSRSGRFIASLPSRSEEGVYMIEARFSGTAIHRASSTTAEARIQIPMRIHTGELNVTIRPDGSTTDRPGGLLVDDRGTPFEAHTLNIVLTEPDGTRHAFDRVTESDGAFSLPPNRFAQGTPGEWKLRVDYDGTRSQTRATIETSFVVTHIVALHLDRVPARANPGETIHLQGHVEASGRGLDTIALRFELGSATMGDTETRDGASWEAHLEVPTLPYGEHPLTVHGHANHSHVHVLPANATLLVTASVQVDLTEYHHEDGARTIELKLTNLDDESPVPDLGVVLLRKGAAGAVQIHRVVSDSEGRAVLELGPHEAGEVSIVTLEDSTFRIKEVTPRVLSAEAPAPAERFWIALTVAAAGLGIAAILVSAYLVWRRHTRRDLGTILQEAHESLLDPAASPAEVVRRCYRRLLAALTEAGYRPTEQETVRDVAMNAMRAFGLPQDPMRTISLLFEGVTYSEEELTHTDRITAMEALERVARPLGVSVKEAPREVGEPPREKWYP